MFWSDRAYAQRAIKMFDEEFSVIEMSLFDFMFRWLPGMSEDEVLVGPNWNGDLVGREKDPFKLREQIQERMPKEMIIRYDKRYYELTGRT